jgi:hypothetical protein
MNSEKQATTEYHPPGGMDVASHDSIDVASHDKKTHADDEYPHGARLAALVISLMLGMFLVALDNVSSPFRECDHTADQGYQQTILGTAIPKITDEFHDLNKVSWYGSAYLMTYGSG